jgi:hypothetical protein
MRFVIKPGRFVQSILLLLTLCLFTQAQTLSEKKFQLANEAEVLLDLTASAPGTSWLEKGREAATASVLVDGNYQQDVILFNGAQRHTYQLLLGRLQPGEHTCRIEFNRKQSAPQATSIQIHDAKLTIVERNQPEFLALAHAPILFARPNTIGKFSDVPLLAYYETRQTSQGGTWLRYTVIFSNEDGGTQTAGLMSRWGRTTDIEYVCETELDAQGRVVKTIFQGLNHVDTAFNGQYEADHPLFFTASDNNNFVVNRTSEMRFAPRPLAFDLSRASREEVMDQHPWTYRIMAEEMVREGKITDVRGVGPLIADLRRYLYLEANSAQQGNVAISFAVKLKGEPHWYPSDWGISGYKIERSGYVRSTILLPPGKRLSQIEKIAARCDVFSPPKREELAKLSEAKCDFKGVNKVFVLGQDFQPVKPLTLRPQSVTLKFGEALEFGLQPK